MYNPCFECKNRYGREFSEDCNNFCLYAMTVKSLKDALEEDNKLIDNLQLEIDKTKRAKAIISAAVEAL